MRFLIFSVALSVLMPAIANAGLDKQLDKFSQDPQWRALLHYPRSGAQSYVDDPRFFLSPSGHRDPLAELQATRREFISQPLRRCDYPARAQWLVDRSLIPASAPVCDEYREWRETLDVQQVSLVLAASYLNSPSSMYGHTFLRFTPGGDRSRSDFLAYALNFGANIPPGENDILYAFRGLFGGYPGLFSMQPYYQKIQEYSRLENRDMWEYQLNLSMAEMDRLLRHVWELRDINFDYFFFDENCSFRLLELLEVARPGIDLTSPFEYAAMPVDTVRAVVDAKMVDEVKYRPSKRLELETLLETLSESEQEWVRRLAAGEVDELDSALAQSRQAQVVFTAYRYLRYQSNRDVRSEEVAERSLRLLRQAKALQAADDIAVTPPARSDFGHGTSLLAVNAGWRDLSDASAQASLAYADLNYRISYHDALDSQSGYPPGATLVMGDINLRWQEREGLRLQEFTIMDIRSLSPRDEFFSPISWKVNFGLERLDDAPSQPLVAQLSAGGGVSTKWLGGIAYAMPGVRMEYNSDFREDWRLAPMVNIGQVWQGAVLSAELAARWMDFSGAGQRKQISATANYAYQADRAWRLQLDYRDQPWGDSLGVELSWRRFF